MKALIALLAGTCLVATSALAVSAPDSLHKGLQADRQQYLALKAIYKALHEAGEL